MKTLMYSLAVAASLAGPALTRLNQDAQDPAPKSNARTRMARRNVRKRHSQGSNSDHATARTFSLS